MTEEQRNLIDRAATSKGKSITQWALEHLISSARHDIDEETSVRLSDKAYDSFLKALEDPMPEEAIELLRREPNWL